MPPAAATLPSLYHAHHSRHTEDLLFWKQLAARQAGPVLELGCGTGRVLAALAQPGQQIVGLDNDWEMLRFLKRRFSEGPRLQPAPVLLQGDLIRFHLAQRFRLILLPCNTYSTLETSDRRSTLECVRSHLAPGGVFAFSIPNPALLRRLPARSAPELEEKFRHPDLGASVEVYSAWIRREGHFTVQWRYVIRNPDGSIEKIRVEVHHTLLPARQHLEELRQAGLRAQALFGDFDRAEYRPESPALIVVASL